MKKIFTTVLAICIGSALWAESALSGSCGPKMQYQYNKAKKTLYITGTGKMNDYEPYQSPWNDFKNEILYIEVSEGVKSLGENAFLNTNRLKQVRLPQSLINIKEAAFAHCGNMRTTLPNNIQNIGNYAFFHTKMSQVKIPSSIQNIGKKAFDAVDSVYMFTHYDLDLNIPFKTGAYVSIETDNILPYFYSKGLLDSVNVHWKVDENDVTIPQRLYNACLIQEAIEYILKNEFAVSNYRNVQVFTTAMHRLGQDTKMLDFLEPLDYIPEVKNELGRFYTQYKTQLLGKRPSSTDYYTAYNENRNKNENSKQDNYHSNWRNWYRIYFDFYRRNDYKITKKRLQDDSCEEIYAACLYGMATFHYKQYIREEYLMMKDCYERGYKPSAGWLAMYYIDKFNKKHGVPPAKSVALARMYADEGMRNGIPMAYLADAQIHMYMGEKEAYYSVMDTVQKMFDKVCVENAWYQAQIAYFLYEHHYSFDREQCSKEMIYWADKAISSGFYEAGRVLYGYYSFGRGMNNYMQANRTRLLKNVYYQCLRNNETFAEKQTRIEQERIAEAERRQRFAENMELLSQCMNTIAASVNAYAQVASSTTSYSTPTYSTSTSTSTTSSNSSVSSSNNNNGVQLQQDRNVYYKWEDTLRKMKDGITPYDENIKRQAQSAMRSIRTKWESRGQTMYHSSLEDW